MVTVMVDNATAGTSITNTVTLDSLDQVDTVSSNNSDSAVIYVPAVDLGVTKSVSDSNPGEGDNVVYTMVVTNNGPDNATGVVFDDVLPTGVSYGSDTGGGDYDDSTGEWTIGNLSSGSSTTLQITVSIDVGTALSSITNTMTLDSVNEDDTVISNNTDSAILMVKGNVDLAVTKTVNDSNPSTNEMIVYTIVVTNSGPHDATSVEYTDTWPISINYLGFTATTGTYNNATRVWSGFDLAAGTNATLSITGQLNNVATNLYITNIIELTSLDQVDTVASNNTNSAVLLSTRVVVSDFDVIVRDGNTVVTWETASELGTAGFNVYRRHVSEARFHKVNRDFVPGLLDSPVGGTYEVLDATALPGRAYEYLLEEREVNGTRHTYGPYRVAVGARKEAGVGKTLVERGFTSRSRAQSKNEITRRKRASGQAKMRSEAAKEAVSAAPNVDMIHEGRFFFDVYRTGIHRLELTDLSSLTGIPPFVLRNHARGAKLRLGIGEEEIPVGLTEAEDALMFYGIHTPNLYSTQTVYWLDFEDGEALQDNSADASSPVADEQSFHDVMVHEVDRKANVLMQRGTRDDYWHEDSLLAGYAGLDTKSYAFDLPGYDSSSNGMLRLYLHGGTATGKANEHHAIVRINGEVVADVNWDGRREMLIECMVSPGLLEHAGNTLEVQALRDIGIPYSFVFMNRFELEYDRRYQASNGAFHFRNRGYDRITVSELPSGNVTVWNVTDPHEPEILTDMLITGSGADAVLTLDGFDPGTEFFLTSEEAFYPVTSLRARVTSTLRDKANNFNYLVITSDDLKSAAQDYADYREARGLRPLVVTVSEIYDHFGDGSQHPDAIRAFLQYAHEEWNGKPRYVLLLGGGTYDYRGITGNTDNIVPALLMYTPSGRFASDGKYADFDGDGLPEIPIGRLPAINEAEVQALRAKVEAYETHPRDDWVRRVVLVTDNTDAGGNFKGSTSGIAAESELPEDVVNLDMNELGLGAARSALLEAWGAGSAFVNYLGHGSHDRLANEGVLKTADVSSMSNLTNMPVLTALSCIVGRFEVPGYDSLGEALVLEQDGGAIAVISASGLLMNHKSTLLGKGIYRARYNDGKGILGDVYLAGLRHYSENARSMGYARLYNLIGDPALLLAGVDAGYEGADGGFDIWWRSRYTVDEQLASGGDAAQHDGDNDGIKDLLEYALGADPHTAGRSIWRRAQLTDNGGKGQMVLEFQRRKGLKDVDYEIQVSGDLEQWVDDPGYLRLDAVLPGEHDSYEIMRYTLDVDEVDQTLYFRLMITRP